MTPRDSARMLFARLRLSIPEARSVLIAPARSSLEVSALAGELADCAAAWGLEVRMLDVRNASGPLHMPDNPGSEALLLPARAPGPPPVDPNLTGQKMSSGEVMCLVFGGGLLDSAETLLSAPSVDAVLLVARRGKTARLDLERCRLEIERAGGRLAGAVLME